jgi:hypothetical protein
MTMRLKLASSAAAVAMALSMTAVPVRAQQQPHAEIAPAAAENGDHGKMIPIDQLLPLTVHQAWLLSGKNEDAFFDMVSQLAELSAKNRELDLPKTAAAGQKVGEMIKVMAKKDTDQLLFAVVDAAVRKVGTPMTATN